MERVDVVVVGARLAGCAVAAPLARAGPAGPGAGQDALPLRSALHARADARGHERAGEDRRAAEDPRPESVPGALHPCRGRRDRLPRAGSPGCRRDRLRSLRTARPAGRAARGIRARTGRRGPRALHASRRCAGAQGESAACATDDADGAEHDVEATLVVGADGRRSTVASLVGAWTPYRLSRNGRGLVFRYLEDPLAGSADAETYYQWREGDSFAFAFPTTPAGKLLVLLMGHRDEAGEARRDPEGYWQRKLARASRPRRPGRRRAAGIQAPLHRRHARVLPRLLGPRLGARRRRRTLQGPGHRPGHARRDVRWAHAGRAGPAGARRPRRRRPRHPQLGGRPRPRVPARLPLRQRRHARRAPLPRAVRARARCGAHDERRTSATCSAARARRSRSRPRRGSREPSSRPSGAASDPRSETLARAAADLRTELEIRRERERRPLPLDPPDRRLRAPRRPWPSRRPRPGELATPPPSARRAQSSAPTPFDARQPAHDRRGRRGLGMTRIAVVQPALALGEVEQNLARVEDLIRDAHREHGAEVIVVPEGFTTPNVYAKVLRGTAASRRRPAAAAAHASRARARLRARGRLRRGPRRGHAYGTFVLAEPDGAVHLHDKDIPTAWEQHFYVGGDDAGVVQCDALGCTVGLMSGWEWARFRTAARVRAAGARLVLGGMCWPSMPLNWPGPLRWWARREHAIWRRQARELPGQVARLTGAPVAHASHVGPVQRRNAARPRHSLADADARRVADLRSRRHDPRPPDARGRRGPRGGRRRPAARRRRWTRSRIASGSRR